MTLTIKQWKGILNAVNSSKGDILKQIKAELKEEQGKSIYQEWEDSNFSLNHLFSVSIDKRTRKLTLLHIAAFNGHTEVVTTLLENRAKVDKKGAGGETPLHLAAENGHTEIVKALIGKGAKVDEKDVSGGTPLHLAAKNGHTEVVTTLLNNGAKVDEKEDNEWTPLHLAAKNGHTEVVTTLLDNGANLSIKDKNGITPRDLLLEKAVSKVVKTGSICGAIAALAVGGGLFAAGVALPMLALIGIAVASALVIGVIAGGITYSVLKPRDKLDEPDLGVNQQVNEVR
ncbi:Phosphocholine transferase AnkX [Wolbachia endosymbiont of Armadillidium vulgare]|nr:Phosphocholine transferase AnkX [Armadillidium vulgare] [Wolbachia endosymbiont of Armadillidium vulgare]OJH30595.1 Phosphocholine transferase AnkX [Armadillidium vulgare] [Wolbachia endosymbiont of Armadillidium vulgare]OJH31303.1 Phosphocholine transferase AnkX [Wolbachia endosymbiont of Armadillidium vulgare]OJH32386.1 Phosphocholine transferase AnkX [Wolbachia endosymbiont of Armadillidium vulgare]